MVLNAIGDAGEIVDWWFMYKVAGKAPRADGGKTHGTEYVYCDPTRSALALSPHTVDKGGALRDTLAQVYGATDPDVGWFFYNDEDPITGKVDGSRGHTKGVLAFDLASDSAFWLIHSTPKFPPKGKYGFPATGMPNAQTFLCVTLKDASVAQAIAKQMFVAQQPHVHLASKIPAKLAGETADARVKLMKGQVASGSTPVHSVLPFLSKAGARFTSIAKNRTWGLDFYNDLVGPTLHEDLDVETWEHDPTPPPRDADRTHKVTALTGVDLSPLGVPIRWPEADDHAKLAISAPSEKTHFVCVGDINFTLAQRKRGGGTVAFQYEPLWDGLSRVLEGVSRSVPISTRARAPPARKPPTRKPAAKRAATRRRSA